MWHARLFEFFIYKEYDGFGLIHNINSKDFQSLLVQISKKKSFKSVERCSKLLGSIHRDIGELNAILTRGGKKYLLIL